MNKATNTLSSLSSEEGGSSTETLSEQDTTADDDDDDDETVGKFEEGHIRKWWKHYLSLAPQSRPKFIPSTKLKSSFVLIQERGVKEILWGRSAAKNPVKAIVERVMATREAGRLVDQEPGGLLYFLFYGKRGAPPRIGISTKLTSFDKHTTTMMDLAITSPETFSYRHLQAYVNNRIAFLRDISECRAKNLPLPTNGPPLPTNNDPSRRYVVNNYIKTNGLELQILGYDTTAAYESKQAVDAIMRIEKVLPDEAAILAAFGGTLPNVVGWDPGEIITAALCLIHHNPDTLVDHGPSDRDLPVSNLLIRRSALYSPTTAARSEREQMKNRAPSVRPGDRISSAIWSQNQGEHGATIHLPSISEMESAMPTDQHDSIQSFERILPTTLSLEPLLVDFYRSNRVAKNGWEEKKSKRSELDMASDAILKLCGNEPSLIAVGNGTFRTGFNLASKHESFKTHFAKKVLLLGHAKYRVCIGLTQVLIACLIYSIIRHELQAT
jgi:hypothetical protein